MTSWEQIEVKVRTLITNLVEPTAKRVLENRSEMDYYHKIQASNTTKIENVEKSLDFLAQKMQSIDAFERKISDNLSSQKLLEVRLDRDKEQIRSKINTVYSQLECMTEDIDWLKNQKNELKSEISILNHSFTQKNSQTNEKVNEFYNKVNSKFMQWDRTQQNIQDNTSQYDGYINKLKNKIDSFEVRVQKAFHYIENYKQFMTDMQKKTTEINNKVNKDIDSMKGTLGISLGNIHQFQNNVNAKISEIPIDCFIDTAQMLKQISTDEDFQLNLIAVEMKMYKEWEDSSLTGKSREKVLTAKQKASESYTQIEQLRKLNSQDAQNIPTEEIAEKNRKHYDSPVKQEKYVDDAMIDKLKRKIKNLKKQDYSNTKDEVNANNDTLVNGLKSLNEKFDELNSKVHNLSEAFAIHKNDTIIGLFNVQGQLEDTRQENSQKVAQLLTKISENYEFISKTQVASHGTYQELSDHAEETTKRIQEILISLDNLSDDIKSVNQIRNRNISDLRSQINSINSKLLSTEDKPPSVLQMESLQKSLDTVIEYLQIQSALESQDEADRDSISLIGMHSNNKQTPTTVSIDPKCVSCSNQKSVVVKAFKMACLLYTPSKVLFQGTEFSRTDLLKAQNSLLYKLYSPVHRTVTPSGKRARTISRSECKRPYVQLINKQL